MTDRPPEFATATDPDGGWAVCERCGATVPEQETRDCPACGLGPFCEDCECDECELCDDLEDDL